MDYTINEVVDGNAVVTFADGGWANVPVMSNDTKETFEERLRGYASTVARPNPAWIAAGQTGSIVQLEFDDGDPANHPAWLAARIAAYGSWASQLEFITENGLTAWQEEVAAIKRANPEP
mgnify:CR=1 FL=1|jgi:hypothetical protein